MLKFEVELQNFKFIQLPQHGIVNKENLLIVKPTSKIYLQITFIEPTYRFFELDSQCATNCEQQKTESLIDSIQQKSELSLEWQWPSEKNLYKTDFSTQYGDKLVNKFITVKAYKTRYKGVGEPLLLGVFTVDLHTVASGPRNIDAFISRNHKIQFSCKCQQRLDYCDVILQAVQVKSLHIDYKENSKDVFSHNTVSNSPASNFLLDVFLVDSTNKSFQMAKQVQVSELFNGKNGDSYLEQARLTWFTAEEFLACGLLLYFYTADKNPTFVGCCIVPLIKTSQFKQVANNVYTFICPIWLNDNNLLVEGQLHLSHTPSFYQMINEEALLTDQGVAKGEFIANYLLPRNIDKKAVLKKRSFHTIYSTLVQKFYAHLNDENQNNNVNNNLLVTVDQLFDWYDKVLDQVNPFINKVYLLLEAYSDEFLNQHQTHVQQYYELQSKWTQYEKKQEKKENNQQNPSVDTRRFNLFRQKTNRNLKVRSSIDNLENWRKLQQMDELHTCQQQEYKELLKSSKKDLIQLKLETGEFIQPIVVVEQ